MAGTTETGAVDPIDEIDQLLHGQTIWHHVDAAFGGFFCTILGMPENPLSEQAQKALACIQRATSVTLDPHKLGYVPYSSGAFLAADVRDYTCVRTLAPYIDYDLNAGDRGPYTLEGSRSAAGAASTWLTARTIGLNASGYGLLLARTIRQKNRLESILKASSPLVRVVPNCDTNILCFTLAQPNEAVSQSNQRCLDILRQLAADKRYYFSKTQFSREQSQELVSQWAGHWDCAELTLLRLCLMNPFLDAQELTVRHLEELAAAILEFASAPRPEAKAISES